MARAEIRRCARRGGARASGCATSAGSASKSREVAGVDVLDGVALRDDPPLLVSALVEVRFAAGTHELYQLPLGAARRRRPAATTSIARRRRRGRVYDALADPRRRASCSRLMRRRRRGRRRPTARVEFQLARRRRAAAAGDADGPRRWASSSRTPRSCSTTQLVLKVFRRVEAGVNPELELLRFLDRARFPNIAAAARLVRVRGPAAGRRRSASLQHFVADARRRLGARARRARQRPRRASSTRLRRPRRGDRRAAHRARLRRRRSRRSRPRSRATSRSRC